MTGDGSPIAVEAGSELSAVTAGELRSAVADALQRGRMIDLHLQSVVSHDVAGLGVLIGLKRRIEGAGGHLACVNPSASLYADIRRFGFHRVLDIRLDLPDPRLGTDEGRRWHFREGQRGESSSSSVRDDRPA